MEDMYTLGYDDGVKNTRKQYQAAITALKDAEFMLRDIEKARELPAHGQVWKQYAALASEIREILATLESAS